MALPPEYVTNPDNNDSPASLEFFPTVSLLLVWDKKRGVLAPCDLNSRQFLHLEDFETYVRHVRAAYAKLDSGDIRDMDLEHQQMWTRILSPRLSWTVKPATLTEDKAAKSEVLALPAQKTDKSGHVYLFGTERGECKIGKAKEVNARMASLAIQLPFKINLLHSFPAKDYHRAERALHQKFADKRMNGEWFALDEADVAWVKAIEKM